ncbi:plastocyanin/azurin family copper-binding protein [Haladaptatus sp. NG-SE-30]
MAVFFTSNRLLCYGLSISHDHKRRTLLTIIGATLAGASLTSCLSAATPGGADDETTTESASSEPNALVRVGPEGRFLFEPNRLEVRPGATVRWIWDSDNHNIVVANQPKDADWNGSPGSASDVYDTGFSFTYTFDVLGTYEYYCQAHRSVGVTGKIVVDESPTGT